MEFVPGQTLEVWQRLPRAWREVIAVYLAAGQGLYAVHQAGLVHRDFKPSNVILGEGSGATRRVRVIDFGLAVADGAGDAANTAALAYGTPFFLSPEQCRGEPVTAKSDQFSFCVALYDALYRQHPYYAAPAASPSRAPTDPAASQPGTNPSPLESLRAAICSSEHTLRDPPTDAAAPRQLFKLLARGLERDPARRYGSMAELLRLLERELRPSVAPWIAGGVLASALTGGVVYSLVEGAPAICERTDSALDSIWNPAREDAIGRAFAATGAPYHREAFTAVKTGVDAYARGWQAVLAAACNDSFTTGALDRESYVRQKQCLDARQHELDLTLGAFLTADAATVEHAYAAIAGLQPVRDCARLQANICATDELLAEVPDLRESFDEVRRLESAGKYNEAAARSAVAVGQAEASKRAPLVAEANYLHGRLLAEQAQWDGARVALTHAIAGATSNGCATLAVDAMNERVRVDGLDTQASEEMSDYLPLVEGALVGIGEAGLRLARAYKGRGLLNQRKRGASATPERRRELLVLAERDYSAALSLLTTVQPSPLTERSSVLRNRGLTVLAQRAYKAPEDREAAAELAKADLEEALRLAREAYGADHPATWRAHFDLGYGLVATGAAARAEEHLRTALRLASAAYDADNIYLARIHIELAKIYDAKYDYPRSLEHARAAEALFKKSEVPATNFYRYAGQRYLAYAYEMLGEHETALSMRKDLEESAKRVPLDPNEELAISYLELGATRISLERFPEARADIERAQQLLDPNNPQHEGLREELVGLHALALAGLRDPAALPELRTAEASARELTQKSDPLLIDWDTWVHLVYALAEATCSDLPAELAPGLAKLPETPRLTKLKTAIQTYDPRTCTPLSQPKPP